MASSLVAYDDNSSSEDEGSPEQGENQSSAHIDKVSTSSNFFAADGDCESDHEDRTPPYPLDKCSTPVSETRLPNPLASIPLPSPNFSSTGSCSGTNAHNSSSVFISAYQLAEEAKQSILERHVKMTTIVDEDASKNSQKRSKTGGCLNFQKGRCRFGEKCRFPHSSANGGMTDQMNDNVTVANPTLRNWTVATGVLRPNEVRAFAQQDEVDEDAYGAGQKKRRAGITDSLVPPKRALGPLKKLREQERPWTVKK